MIGGLLRAYDWIDARIYIRLSEMVYSGGASASCAGELLIRSERGYDDVAGLNAASQNTDYGVRINSSADGGGGGSFTVALYRNGIVLATSGPTAQNLVIESRLRFNGYKVWFQSNAYRYSYDSIQWYVQGVLTTTLGAGAGLISLNPITPGGVPFFGLPPTVKGAVEPSEDIGVSNSVSGRFEFGGGWKFRADGQEIELPVRYAVEPPRDLGGACSVIDAPAFSATTTWDLSVQRDFGRVYSFSSVPVECAQCADGSPAVPPVQLDRETSDEIKTKWDAEFVALPSGDRDMRRLCPNYGAVVYRGGLPKTDHYVLDSCNRSVQADSCFPGVDTASSLATRVNVHAAQSSFLATVQDDEHLIEAPIAAETLAPYHYSVELTDIFRVVHVPTAPGGCAFFPFPYHGCCYSNVLDSKIRTTTGRFPYCERNAQTVGYLNHGYGLGGQDGNWQQDVPLYLNTWAAILWSYYLYGPYAADPVGWRVANIKRHLTDYWWKLRQQHIEHQDLPVNERLKCRNSIKTEPLLHGPIYAFLNSMGLGDVNFWGISRFKAALIAPTESYALTSASLGKWSFANATAAHSGSSITVTPSGGATSVSADFPMGKFGHAAEFEPWFYDHWANRIEVGWSGANIVSVAVKLVNQQGETFVMGSAPGLLEKPLTVFDSYYAGSWGQDFGIGLATDQGIDLLANGRSAATMADPERTAAYELALGKTATILRFEFSLSSDAAFTLNYPIFRSGTGPITAAPESGNVSLLVNSDGAALRFGQIDVYETGANYLEDTAASPTRHETWDNPDILDWLVFKRAALLAKAPTDGLAAEIASLFDPTVEGSTYAHLADDAYAVLLTPTAIGGAALNQSLLEVAVNSLSQLPALPVLLEPARDHNLQATAGWGQFGYSSIPRKQYLLAPVDRIDLFQAEFSGASETSRQRLSEDSGAFPELSRWKVSQSQTPSNGVEESSLPTPRWLMVGEHTGDLARTSGGWRGYTGISAQPSDENAGVSYHVGANQRHAIAYARNGDLYIGLGQNAAGTVYNEVATGLEGGRPSIRLMPTANGQRIWLLHEHGGELRLAHSDNEGATWDMAITIDASMDDYSTMTVSRDRRLCVYWIEGAAIKGKILDALGNVMEPEFTAVSSGVDPAPIDTDDYALAPAQWYINLMYRSGGALIVKTSSNGKDFA